MMRAILAGGVLVAVAVVAVTAGHPSRGVPLWPGARYTRQDRDHAVRRGMTFLYGSIARNPAHFAEWGHDLLSAFYNIAETSAVFLLCVLVCVLGCVCVFVWCCLFL